MYSKLGTALAATIVVCAIACSTAFAEYEGPLWKLKGSYVTESTSIKTKGELTLEDSKIGYKVACLTSGESHVKPEGHGEINTFTLTSCKGLKGCAETEVTVKAGGTPWSTQLEEPEIEVESGDRELKEKITKGTFAVECLVIGIKVKDECAFESTSAAIEDVSSGVDLIFGSKSPHGNCTVGGAGTGVLTGTDIDENHESQQLAVANFLSIEIITTETRKENGSRACEFALLTEGCTVEVQNRGTAPAYISLKELRGTEANKRYGVPAETLFCTLGTRLEVGTGRCSDRVKPVKTPEIGWGFNFYRIDARNGAATSYITREATLSVY